MNRAGVLAVGTGRELRALPKANRPRGGGGIHRPRQKAIQQAGMAIFPCAAGLCSFKKNPSGKSKPMINTKKVGNVHQIEEALPSWPSALPYFDSISTLMAHSILDFWSIHCLAK